MIAAITAAVMSILNLIEMFFGFSFGVTQGHIEAALVILTPILVWLVPSLMGRMEVKVEDK